jgi:hypothetical protein
VLAAALATAAGRPFTGLVSDAILGRGLVGPADENRILSAEAAAAMRRITGRIQLIVATP